MDTSTKKVSLQQRWIWYHLAGSFLAVILSMAFDAMLEWLKLPLSQAVLGLGMGTAIGLMQWLVLRRYGIPQSWIWFTVAGLTLGYLLFNWLGKPLWDLANGNALLVATLVGALIAGWLQYRFILKAISGTSAKWIGVYTLAWVVAHATAAITGYIISSPLPRGLIVTLNISLILAAGPLLGWITGRYLLPLLRDRPVRDALMLEGDLI
jgi:hypothetical protein